jgi:hypothetical protein
MLGRVSATVVNLPTAFVIGEQLDAIEPASARFLRHRVRPGPGLGLAYLLLVYSLERPCPSRQGDEAPMSVANGRELLNIPGPTNIPDAVLAAMHRPAVDIYSGAMLGITHSLHEDLPKVFRTAGRGAPTSTRPTGTAAGRRR